VSTDWSTVSSLATAGGTLVLAVATFSSVRSANRAARTAERALLVGLRPVLVPSRFQDEPEKVMWGDRHWAKVAGGCASVEILDGVVYLAMSLRNVGSGIGVLHGWHAFDSWGGDAPPHRGPDEFRTQLRDLVIAPADRGFWQGAIRDTTDPDHLSIRSVIDSRRPFTIDLLYGDHEGGQRTIARIGLFPRDNEETQWLLSLAHLWNLDRPDPR